MLKVLDPGWPGEPFPPAALALDEPDGLLAVGGCLSVERLVSAYRQGIFPWFSEGEPILWWSPNPRWTLSPQEVRVSRSLAQRIRRGDFTVTFDQAFEAVIGACAASRPGQEGTWITQDIQEAYLRLHQQGFAHSFECWREGQLVGGLYGVALGQCFFGESMFRRETDASKVAFVAACRKLEEWGYQLIDCQVHTAHLESLGARAMNRAFFLDAVEQLSCRSPASDAWMSN
jgi:leucyl/phenylalanyl-tRNA--protein transferase